MANAVSVLDVSAQGASARAMKGAPRRASTRQILDAAEYAFARAGFAGTTMAAIAEGAGLPKANLHYYFGSKEQLYRAVLEDILSSWLKDGEIWIDKALPARDGFAGFVAAKMTWSRNRPDASRIFAGELLSGALQIRRFLEVEVRARVAAMDAVFRHWAATGQMRPVSTAHVLFCLWSMTQSYADFSPQMEAVLGRRDGLTQADFAEGTQTIVQMLTAGLILADKT